MSTGRSDGPNLRLDAQRRHLITTFRTWDANAPAHPAPDPEVVAKPVRRQFSAAYRLRIIPSRMVRDMCSISTSRD